VTVLPSPNETGTTTITLAATDGTNADFESFDLTVNPSAPTVTANNLLTLARGSTATITQSLLRATDPDTGPGNLVYTVVSPPAAGTLKRNGTTTASFSQADVDAGRVGYTNAGGSPATDSFTFTVTDGTTTVNETFGIALTGAATLCEPRLPVRLRTRVLGPGRLEATLTATGLDVPFSNRLQTVRLENAVNARVFHGGTQLTAGVPVSLPAGTVETTLVVERVNPALATTVPLVVADSCGEWPTFVGGGAGSF
jgi:hypothetical protein